MSRHVFLQYQAKTFRKPYLSTVSRLYSRLSVAAVQLQVFDMVFMLLKCHICTRLFSIIKVTYEFNYREKEKATDESSRTSAILELLNNRPR